MDACQADAAGQQWRRLVRQAALRGKGVSMLEPAAYGGHKDASAAWATGVLAAGAGPAAAAAGSEVRAGATAHTRRVTVLPRRRAFGAPPSIPASPQHGGVWCRAPVAGARHAAQAGIE